MDPSHEHARITLKTNVNLATKDNLVLDHKFNPILIQTSDPDSGLILLPSYKYSDLVSCPTASIPRLSPYMGCTIHELDEILLTVHICFYS